MWSIFGYLLSGLVFWGGVGYGLDKWLDRGIFTLIGMLVGISCSIYLVWLRFGRE
jgi:ATP synthase protein I